MDIFAELETAVLSLKDSVVFLRTSERRAENRAVAAEVKCSALQEENRKLRQSLEEEKLLRQEAVARIDALLQKVQEYAEG